MAANTAHKLRGAGITISAASQARHEPDRKGLFQTEGVHRRTNRRRMIYLFLYGSLPVCGVIFHDRHDVRRFFYTIWIFFFLYLLWFRLKVGCDCSGYEHFFERKSYADVLDAIQQREPLFSLANTLLHRYDLEYPYINVICSFVFFLGIHWLAKREPDPYANTCGSLPDLGY